MGILRRAFERGKALPKKLERALKIQAGLALPDGQITDIDAYHINQRDEGIDLQGVSGALMATSNMQMQTFVTQASENTEGFDGYNGDLTGDVAATLGVNCGMSTGRNGVIAFAANQRDEVRDLHDVAGALNAQPGIKQQTFVAGFSAGAGASAGSIGYHESVAPTLKAGASGNCMPSVLCINDQGGQVMEISEGMTGTLRAQEHGHQPLVYKRISDISSQNQTLAFLKQQGLVDPDIFIAKTNELTKQLQQAKLEKEKLMDAESDMTALQTRDLIDILEDGPEFLDSFDAELFAELVEKIIIESNDSVRFCLKNGLELRESIERTVR